MTQGRENIYNISMILAVSENGIIGNGEKLLWNCKKDLAFFKKITKGFTVVMGSKTFFSIGKALPLRKNYVLTSKDINIPNLAIVRSFEEVLELSKNEQVFIIGGKSLYEYFYTYAKEIYVTIIKGGFFCDNPIKINIETICKDMNRTLIEKHSDCEMYLYSYIYKK
jgi:dihydrofolate reductase